SGGGTLECASQDAKFILAANQDTETSRGPDLPSRSDPYCREFENFNRFRNALYTHKPLRFDRHKTFCEIMCCGGQQNLARRRKFF
ncbi:hypothetical protein ABTM87_19665, partial [Acinetobacter baumannii]